MNTLKLVVIILTAALVLTVMGYVELKQEVSRAAEQRYMLEAEVRTLRRLYERKIEETGYWVQLYKYQKAAAEDSYRRLVEIKTRYEEKRRPVVFTSDHQRDSVIAALYGEVLH